MFAVSYVAAVPAEEGGNVVRVRRIRVFDRDCGDPGSVRQSNSAQISLLDANLPTLIGRKVESQSSL